VLIGTGPLQKARFKFEFSGMKTYWSNQKTMHAFVNNILAPYFTRRKVELRLPIEQKSLWQIDVWSVHHSKEFRDWMHVRHLNVIIDFVPGSCTGVHQPCDVGIQQPLKLSTSLIMKILSMIFWKSWTKAILHWASMIALELFAIRKCDGCGMCIELWTIKNLLKRYVSAWIKMRSYLFFRHLKAVLYAIGIYHTHVWRASRHEKHYETWGPQNMNFGKNLPGANMTSNCLTLLKH
jgi:hypothetical protein